MEENVQLSHFLDIKMSHIAKSSSTSHITEPTIICTTPWRIASYMVLGGTYPVRDGNWTNAKKIVPVFESRNLCQFHFQSEFGPYTLVTNWCIAPNQVSYQPDRNSLNKLSFSKLGMVIFCDVNVTS